MDKKQKVIVIGGPEISRDISKKLSRSDIEIIETNSKPLESAEPLIITNPYIPYLSIRKSGRELRRERRKNNRKKK